MECVYVFGVYDYRTWHIDTSGLSCGFRIAIGALVILQLSAQKAFIMEMRLKDYKYLTDYRAHKRWGHDALWTISNVTLISPGCCHFKQAMKVIWKWDELPFRTILTEIHDRTQCCILRAVRAAMIMTTVAFCWRPLHRSPLQCSGFPLPTTVTVGWRRNRVQPWLNKHLT